MTLRVKPTPAHIAQAATRLREGHLVAFPTETVYGLGADATNDTAVAHIFKAKGRPHFNPLIVHVSDAEKANEVSMIDAISQVLIEKFWPGPLTLVLPRRDEAPLSLLVSAGLDSVAVRQPAHAVAHALLREAGRPIAAPSANRSGRLSPTTADHVAESLGEDVSMILDGGPCARGLESTIVQVSDKQAALLRPGALTREEIEAVLGQRLALGPQGSAPTAPGQLASHYAPSHALRLNAHYIDADEALLAFGQPLRGKSCGLLNLSPRGDLWEAAAHLFSHLRTLDQAPCARIAVMPIPHHGLGEAINDRLARAAAPRG